MPDDLLQFKTHHHLKERLQLSILSGRSILITQIRPDDVHIGLRDYEISLLRLLEKVTNGSTIEISVTGVCLCRVTRLTRSRNVTFVPPRLVAWRFLLAYLPPRPVAKLLSGRAHPVGALLQESL